MSRVIECNECTFKFEVNDIVDEAVCPSCNVLGLVVDVTKRAKVRLQVDAMLMSGEVE